MSAPTQRPEGRGPAGRILALSLVLGLATSFPARAGTETDTAGPAGGTRPGKHAALGLTVGAIAGTILGSWAAWYAAEGGEAAMFATWSGLAVGGAIAGYAAGGGFSKNRIDLSLEQGRDAVRVAQSRAGSDTVRQAAPEPIRTLRLSSLPGLDPAALAQADGTTPELLACVR